MNAKNVTGKKFEKRPCEDLNLKYIHTHQKTYVRPGAQGQQAAGHRVSRRQCRRGRTHTHTHTHTHTYAYTRRFELEYVAPDGSKQRPVMIHRSVSLYVSLYVCPSMCSYMCPYMCPCMCVLQCVLICVLVCVLVYVCPSMCPCMCVLQCVLICVLVCVSFNVSLYVGLASSVRS